MKGHGHWEARRRCVKCRGYLSKEAIYYNNGICPLCGHLGSYAGTITQTEAEIGRWRWRWWPPRWTWEVKS